MVQPALRYTFSERDVEAVSAMKRRFEKRAFPDGIKQRAQQRCNCPALIRRHRIVLVDGPSCAPAQYIQLAIHAAVPFARGHFSRSVDIVSPSKGIDKMLRQTSRQNGDDIEAQ